MKANISKIDPVKAKIKEKIHEMVGEYMDEQMDKFNNDLEGYYIALDASVLYTLYADFGFGEKRLSRFFDAVIKNRTEVKEFFRDGKDDQGNPYRVMPNGQNIEDFAMIQELKKIGVDLLEWERGN